jgi:Holliday junction resolvase RusA-like endonuclease
VKLGIQLQLKSQHQYISPFDGPLQLDITFFMFTPNRLSKKKHFTGGGPQSTKPDIDNLLKMLLDCANGVIIKDDALVATVIARKIYSACPRTEFSITRLEPNGCDGKVASKT